MGYGHDDDRYGRFGGDDQRWQGNRYEREGGSYGNWGSGRGEWGRGGSGGGGDWNRERGGGYGGGRDDDRGFFERAGEQVRSWFGDDDDRGGRDRYRDENVRWERSSEGQFRGDPVHFNRGGDRTRGGFDRDDRSWNMDRGGDRARNMGGMGGGSRGYAGDYQSSGGGGGGGADTWGGSGFGGLDDNGRRFDRIDAGSTGTQGAHPMSSPVDAGYGMGASFGGGSSARSAAILRQSQQGGGQHYGQQSHHDPHYSEWRQRQIEDLDRDYDDYRREHQSKFDQEFGGWRQKRQGQRQQMGRVTEHMEVLGSDGQHIGTVDKVRGDKIILTKNDEKAGGVHHSIPCSWIESVDEQVRVNKTAEEAFKAWTDEDSNRALFERQDQGSEGPHVLNRSFSGTYDDNR